MAEQLAMALAAGELSGLPLAGDADRAHLDYDQATGALDEIKPKVSVGLIEYDEAGTTAIARLDQRYEFDNGSWSFSSPARLQHGEDGWLLDWNTEIVHPELGPETRLYHERMTPRRAPIIDVNGSGIVENRPVYRVGIDKTKVDPEQVDASARALAALVEVDADAFAAQLAAAGPQAFVVAIVLREGQVPAAIDDIPGAAAYGTTRPLGPSATFARGLLGTADEATAESIEKSGGVVKQGDIVGMSGLQAIHDEQLRGVPGHAVSVIKRSEAQLSELPPLASPSPTAQPTDASSAPSAPATPKPTDQELFKIAPVEGEPLQLTMNLELQHKAEQLLADYDRLVMLVVLDRETGGIVVAASSPQSGAQPFVTTGHYPPGSTMKVVTALALLRKGYTPDTMVDCSATTNIGGRVFNNYPGYPAALTGQITLRTALQQSCNTAFMNAGRSLSGAELADAAASLGIGVDYETGFDAFYGAVPTDGDEVQRAANTIGQGQIMASPMAMAAEAASVASGKTIIPYLVQGQTAQYEGTPLTAAEAEMLRDMTRAVVDGGTLADLGGVLEGGKSGTAEYTDDNPPRTHGWVVGYTGNYAICAMDYDQSNSAVPQDVIRAFLA